ncbi:MAG: hypothetical protein OXH57_09160 [Ekhidna sp.]|nr:hypothetical protein [Ekhidna sp.]
MPTAYGSASTDIFKDWNLNIDGTDGADDPWDFGENDEYPVLKVDFNNSNGDNNITTGTADDVMRQRP